jgi:exosortase/archaeosortase
MAFFISIALICLLNIVRVFATRGIYSSKARYYDYVNDRLL